MDKTSIYLIVDNNALSLTEQSLWYWLYFNPHMLRIDRRKWAKELGIEYHILHDCSINLIRQGLLQYKRNGRKGFDLIPPTNERFN